MLSAMDSPLAVRALGALANASRLAVFRLLVIAGPRGMAAGDIAQALGHSPSGLSFHLNDLSRAELVQSRQDGRFVFYFANFETMRDVIGFLTENCCEGESCAAVPASADPPPKPRGTAATGRRRSSPPRTTDTPS